uniref:Uncharacterized protein n=2 Tax=Triticum urartu TaxID=4572 RepID=A0A8R7PAP5_TRIUA
MMRRCELPARDLRLLDPLFIYPSTVLGRERAIVVNLEQIRCVITADEVLLLNSLDNYVFQYAAELQRRLLQCAEGDELLFEFRALEHTLEVACSFLDAFIRVACSFFEFRALALEVAWSFLELSQNRAMFPLFESCINALFPAIL